MRGILVVAILFIIFGTVTLLLLLKERRRIDKIVGELDSYYSGIKERRRTIRINKKLNVTCKIPQRSNSHWSVFSKDISGEGICLYLPEILPKDAVINLEINIPGKKRIIARGEVVWVKEIEAVSAEGKRQFNAGIRFIGIAPEDKKDLADFIMGSLTKTENKGGMYE